MDIILTVISIVLIVFAVSFAFIGLDYLNNHLQKKKREEYFKNLNECIIDALNRANKA